MDSQVLFFLSFFFFFSLSQTETLEFLPTVLFLPSEPWLAQCNVCVSVKSLLKEIGFHAAARASSGLSLLPNLKAPSTFLNSWFNNTWLPRSRWEKLKQVIFATQCWFTTLSSQLPGKLNEVDRNGDLALDLALSRRLESIATTLVSHKADVDMVDKNGWSLLHKGIQRGRKKHILFFSAGNILYPCGFEGSDSIPEIPKGISSLYLQAGWLRICGHWVREKTEDLLPVPCQFGCS